MKNICNNNNLVIFSLSVSHVENKEKGNDNEIPVNTVETKNTINEITSNGIEIIPNIQNIVSTAELNCKLNLIDIALKANNIEYKPKRFSALIMRIKEPKATAQIFSTGKIVCLGTKNEEQSKNACRKIVKSIKKLGYNVNLTNFKIQNIVGSCKLKFTLLLNDLFYHIKNEMNSIVFYKPEIFPGLIYHYLKPTLNNEVGNKTIPNITYHIYSSGNIIITGAKTINQIYEAFSRIYPLLYIYQEFK